MPPVFNSMILRAPLYVCLRKPVGVVAFRPTAAEQQASLARIEACVSHVDSWLVRNKLKLNRGKTELLILSASHRPRPPIDAIQVSSERIIPARSARNIGVILDQEMSLDEHALTYAKLAFFILGI